MVEPDESLLQAAALRDRVAGLVHELDRLRTELREAVAHLAEAGVPDEAIAAATGIHPRKVDRLGRAQALITCGFCGASAEESLKMVAGPGVYICDRCVAAGEVRTPTSEVCSFCGKGAVEVTGVHVAPDGRAVICDQCLHLCTEIVKDDLGGAQP